MKVLSLYACNSVYLPMNLYISSCCLYVLLLEPLIEHAGQVMSLIQYRNLVE